MTTPPAAAKIAPKFTLGQQVWRPTFESSEKWIECPDCGGTGRLRVTFHDETTVSIDCQNCSVGYDPPTGKVRIYERKPEAYMGTVSGIEMEPDKVTYKIYSGGHGSYWLVSEDDLSTDRDEALAKAQVRADEAAAEELARIARKEKDTRTWAWNASYHRKAIKEAQRNLDYHTRKLAAANLKVRDEKRPAVEKTDVV